MFSRREPREVYRVYGEDELFSEQPADQGNGSNHFDAPAQLDPMFATAVSQPPMQAQPAPIPAQPAPMQAPQAYEGEHQDVPGLSEEVNDYQDWGYADQQTNELPSEHSEPEYAPSPEYVPSHFTHQEGKQENNQRNRVLVVAITAAVLGLLVGLIAVNAMRSSSGQSATKPPAAPAQSTPTPTTAQVQSAPKPGHTHSKTTSAHVHLRAHKVVVHFAVSSHQKPHKIIRGAVVHSSTPTARAPIRSQAPVQSSAPVSVQATSSSSSDGTEFGFEH